MNQIDPNTVLAGVATDLMRDFFRAVGSGLSLGFLKQYEKLFPGFEKHLIEVHRRVSIAKVVCA